MALSIKSHLSFEIKNGKTVLFQSGTKSESLASLTESFDGQLNVAPGAVDQEVSTVGVTNCKRLVMFTTADITFKLVYPPYTVLNTPDMTLKAGSALFLGTEGLGSIFLSNPGLTEALVVVAGAGDDTVLPPPSASVTLDGDLHVTGKVTVDGLIDPPIGLNLALLDAGDITDLPNYTIFFDNADKHFKVKGLSGAITDLSAGGSSNTILNGTGAPSGGTGADGDFYIDTAADAIYGPKIAGVWGSATSLIGPAGTNGTNGSDGADGTNGVDGKTVLNGVVPPTTQGVDGDFYIDTAASNIYGPKTAGVWGSPTSLIGPQGPVSYDYLATYHHLDDFDRVKNSTPPDEWNVLTVGTGSVVGGGSAANITGTLLFETDVTGDFVTAYRDNVHYTLGSGSIEWKTSISVVALSTAADEYKFQFGLMGTSVGTLTAAFTGAAPRPRQSLFFIYDRTVSTNWLARSTNATSVTSVDTGVAVVGSGGTTYTKFKIVVNSAGTSVDYYIDNVLVATITTTLPTQQVHENYGYYRTSDTGTPLFVSSDYSEITYTYNTPR